MRRFYSPHQSCHPPPLGRPLILPAPMNPLDFHQAPGRHFLLHLSKNGVDKFAHFIEMAWNANALCILVIFAVNPHTDGPYKGSVMGNLDYLFLASLSKLLNTVFRFLIATPWFTCQRMGWKVSDEIMTWKRFPHSWPFVKKINRRFLPIKD